MQQNVRKDLETLCKNSRAYVHELKDKTFSMLREKLNDFETEFVCELQKEMSYFTVIKEKQDVDESVEKLKRQLKVKLKKLKDMHDYLELFQLSSKLVAVDPLLVQSQYQPDMDLDMLKRTAVNVELSSDNEFADQKKKQRKHKTKLYIDYRCPVCFKQLNSSYGARMHIRIVHGIEHNLFCPHSGCKFVVGQAMDLAKHLINNHSLPKNRHSTYHYQCEFSGKFFRTKTELQYHITQEKGYLSHPIILKVLSLEDSDEGFI